MQSRTVEVIENINIQDNIYILKIPADRIPAPGQFVMIKKVGSKHLLARPISVCNVEDNNIHLLYQAVGRGTNELALLKIGDKVEVTGPIGHGMPKLDYSTKRIALLGGGVGAAPLVYIANKFKSQGIHTDAHIAFRDKSILKAELEEFCDNVFVATESGAEGEKGYVTSTFDPKDYDFVFCCGPMPMMKTVVNICKEAGTEVYVSLENKMGCGVGGCYVCTCFNNDGKAMRTCIEGPIFNGLEVNFDA